MKRAAAFAIPTLVVLLAVVILHSATAEPASIGMFPVAIAVDQRTGRTFVANYSSDTVSMLATETGAAMRTTYVAPGPLALAVDEHTGRVFVASQGAPNHPGSVSVLNAAQGTLLHTTVVGRGPAAIAVDEALGRIFILNLIDQSMSMLDSASGHLMRTIPVALAPAKYSESPSCRGMDTLDVCYGETTAGRMLALTTQGADPSLRQSAQGLVVDPVRNHLFVVATVRNTVLEFDARTGMLLHTIHVGRAPCALVIDPHTGDAVVTNLDDNSASILDTNYGVVRRTVSVGQAPGPVAFDAQSGRAIVANFGDGTLSMFTLRGGTTVQTIGVGMGPNALAVDQGTGRIVVATLSADSGNAQFFPDPARVSVLDPTHGALVRATVLGDGPDAVAVDEKRGRALLISVGPPQQHNTPQPLWTQWLQWLQSKTPLLAPPDRSSHDIPGSVTVLTLAR